LLDTFFFISYSLVIICNSFPSLFFVLLAFNGLTILLPHNNFSDRKWSRIQCLRVISKTGSSSSSPASPYSHSLPVKPIYYFYESQLSGELTLGFVIQSDPISSHVTLHIYSSKKSSSEIPQSIYAMRSLQTVQTLETSFSQLLMKYFIPFPVIGLPHYEYPHWMVPQDEDWDSISHIYKIKFNCFGQGGFIVLGIPYGWTGCDIQVSSALEQSSLIQKYELGGGQIRIGVQLDLDNHVDKVTITMRRSDPFHSTITVNGTLIGHLDSDVNLLKQSHEYHPHQHSKEKEINKLSLDMNKQPHPYQENLEKAFHLTDSLMSSLDWIPHGENKGVAISTKIEEGWTIPVVRGTKMIEGWSMDDISRVINSSGARKICKYYY